MKIIDWIKSKLARKLGTVYILREVDEEGNIADCYFKKKRNLIIVYSNYMMLRHSEHYKMWCSVHEYSENQSSWGKYLEVVNPKHNYVFLRGKVSVNDIRYKYFSYEEVVKAESQRILEEIKNKQNEENSN